MNENSNLRTNSIKKSCLFGITISFVSVPKINVFNFLEPYCIKLLISEECHYDNQPHHHVFMRTIEKYSLSEVRSLIYHIYNIPFYGDETEVDDKKNFLDISTVRNEKNFLIYATKADTNPLFTGISESSLSFYYRSIKWAKNTSEFKFTDAHVLNYPQYYKLLEKVHSTVQKEKSFKEVRQLRTYDEQVHEDSWHKEVKDWWNEWVINGFQHKKKQLYLWGPSNTGKTTFISNLLKKSINLVEDEEDHFEIQVFRPTPNDKKFAWQEFDSNLHRVVMIDEFSILDYNVCDLKKLLAGEYLVANRKCQNSKKICARMPMIIISNLPPPASDNCTQMQGFTERLKVIQADKLIN